MMSRISEPWVIRNGSGLIVGLPLPPSTNRRMRPVRMGRVCRDILTAEARDYVSNIGQWLRLHVGDARQLNSHEIISCWVIMPRRNCDPHNYFKIAFDAIEAGGWCSNDKYILPSLRGIWHDAKEPEFIFQWEAA